jgi:hypothetical protein
MAAMELGNGGATAAAEPASVPEAAAGVAVTRIARSRATPRLSARNGLGISELRISELPGRLERDASQRMTDLAVAA